MTKLESGKNKQVVSKKRVADHGEVFTSNREVNAMLDLVKQETERIESRFLEPACGTGNFLVEVLKRKLAVVENRYSKNQLEYERYAILALSSIYGVDILQDNVQTCRDRLLGIFTHYYLNNLLNKWKLLVPPAPIAGQTDFSKPVGFYYDGNTRIAKPGECCTESFIVAGAFSTNKEIKKQNHLKATCSQK